MRVQTWDKKIYDVPEENLEGFLSDYNKATNFDPAKVSSDPNINPERGANWAGTARAAAQGVPAVGSYADEAEALARTGGMKKSDLLYMVNPGMGLSIIGSKMVAGAKKLQTPEGKAEYEKYLNNARESTEGAFKNTPTRAYAANIGTGILGEAALAYLTGGASLTPVAQGAMGAVYGYGAGEGDWKDRTKTAAIMGTASAALPLAGKYVVAPGAKAVFSAGKKAYNKIGEKIVQNKIPETVKALKKVADPKTAKTALYINPKGETDMNVLSTVMNTADDYATQAKVATELVKETPKNAGLYNSEIMQSANDLANIGWKNQVVGAVDDVASRVTNEADRKILGQISEKLSQATRTTIESADNALEEVELKNVKEIVNYALDKFGKGLTKKTRDMLEKRMISEGMAKRVSNKLVSKPLAESAKTSLGKALIGDIVTYAAGNILTPGAGPLAVVGKNILRGGTGSAVKKHIANKATSKAAETIVKSALPQASKQAENSILNSLLGPRPTAPRLIQAFSKPNVVPKQTPLLMKPTLYQQPIMQSLVQ